MENEQAVQQPEISLVEIYFQRIDFDQIRGDRSGEIKLKINNSFDFAKSNDNKNVRTTINTTIGDEIGRIKLNLITVGIFKFRDGVDPQEQKFPQIMVNTIWPFVRTQVSLVSTQPGIMPIMLPIQNPRVQTKSNGDPDPDIFA